MDAERYRRISRLFDEVADLPRAEQVDRLAQEMDPDLVAEVRSLLGYADPQVAGVLDDSELGDVAQELLREVQDEARGTAIPVALGDYRLQRELGLGGMGVVYAATRESDGAQVAIKLIRPGLDSERLLKRFRRESEVMQLLAHPGIARLVEAGSAPLRHRDGREEPDRPFLAMQLVEGVPITDHADRAGLDDRERLELVARACDALDHAHRHGVVHRDLKPANLLVVAGDDRIGQPVLLDFGVAHASRDDLATMTRTATGSWLGTLAYMSPEQVAGEDRAEPRSDLYSLGVVLFELLAGRLPYDIEGRSVPQVARLVQETDPLRLSSFHERFRGGIDLVVGKVLEKSPADRYASAAAFAEDLRRLVAERPVRARPPSLLSRGRRFARRYRILVSTVAATMLSLAVGLAFAVHFALAESEQRVRAQGEADRADRNAREAKRHADDAGVLALEAAEQARRADAQAAAAEEAARRADANATTARAEALRADVQAYRAVLTGLAAIGDFHPGDLRKQLGAVREDLRGWEWQHLASRFDDSLEVRQVCDQLITESVAMAFEPDGGVLWLTLRTGARSPQRLLRWSLDEAGPVEIGAYPDVRDTWFDVSARRLYLVGPKSIRAVSLDTGEVGVGIDVSARVKLFPTGDPDRVVFSRGAAFEVYSISEGTRRPLIDREWVGSDVWFDATRRQAVVRCWEHARIFDLQAPTGYREVPMPYPGWAHAAITAAGDRVLASQPGRAEVLQWRLEDDSFVAIPGLRGGKGRLRFLQFGHDERLALAGTDHEIWVWDSRTGALEARFSGHEELILALAVAPDGRSLYSVDRRASLRRWYLGEDPRTVQRVREAHCARFLRYNGTLASGAVYSPLLFVDAASSREVGRWGNTETFASSIDEHPRRPWIAYGTESPRDLHSRVEVLDLRDASMVRVVHEAEKRGLFKVAFSPDGSRLAGVSHAEGVLVWETANWELVARTEITRAVSPNDAPALAWLEDQHLAVAGEPGSVQILRADDLAEVRTLEGHDELVMELALHPDGGRLASASRSGLILVHDWRSAETEQRLEGHTGIVFALAFHPAGGRLVSGGADRTVRFWGVDVGAELASFSIAAGWVRDVEFDAEGRRLVVVSGSGALHLLELDPLRARVQAGEHHDLAMQELERSWRTHEEQVPEERGGAVIEAFLEESSADPRRLRLARQYTLRRALEEWARQNPPAQGTVR